MGKLSAGIAISAAVHAAAVAWVSTRSHAGRHATPAATATTIEIVTIAGPVTPTAALDVALLDLSQVPAPRDPQATAPRPTTLATARPAPAGRPDDPAITAPAPSSTTEPAPPHSALMSMRRGELARTTLPAGRWDDLDHPPAGTAPVTERDQTTGMLHESGGGTYQSDQHVFVGKVAADGSVKLTDSRNLQVSLALPSARDLGRGLAAWYDSDKGPHGADAPPPLAAKVQMTPGATTDPPDPITGKVNDQTPTVVVPVLGGSFDTTDWLMRRHGQDPYASRKLAFLDKTRDERAQIGSRYRAEQLALSPQLVQRNLAALWAATPDLRDRKQALFELWDECAETGDPGLVASGQAARRLVIGFIRARLPAGSADAFTPAELAALARTQQSKASFAPYD